jgi:DNA-binding transcriptional ArsR family regulator
MHDPQAIFKAIADPTRRAIIGLLSRQDMTVNEVAAHFDMTRPAVTKHLAILRSGEIITVEARGRERINSLRPEALMTVADWAETYSRVWDKRLSNLKTAVEDNI